MALTLGRLLGQDVATERLLVLEAVGRLLEALGSAAITFHFRHEIHSARVFSENPGPVAGLHRPPVELAYGSLLLGGNNHRHLAPFHFRERLYGSDIFQIRSDPFHQLAADVLVRHLTAAETQRDLALVATFEETNQVTQLDLIVALVGARPEFDFLDLNLLLLFLLCRLLLFLLEDELAVIHDLADDRIGIGNLNQIETFRLGALKRFRSEEHTSELQSRPHLVCRLLLEKKKT